MISWIQITFEKHTKAFLAFLLIVITIPFVFTIGASPGIGRGGRKIRSREFFGYNLSSAGVERQMRVDTQISVFLKLGFMVPAEHPQLVMLAYDRLATLALADRNHIAAPSATELSNFITTFRAFQNEQGQFDAKRYADFADQIKANPLFTVADVARVMADEYRIQRINTLLAGPGYVLPAEVTARLIQRNTQWTVRVAEFDLATYTPAIKPTEAALAAYFETNASRYEIPPRANVDYVLFTGADFMPAGPIGDNDVTAYFEANKARFTPASSDPAKPAVAPELAAVRPAVEAAMREQAGANGAAKAASDFAYALFDKKLAKDSPAINELAAHYRGKRATAPLFTSTEPPAGLAWPRQIVAEAFRLSDKRYYSDPLAAGNDQVVLLWKETQASYKPVLAEVREKVVADFTAEEQRRLLTENGRQWKAAVEARLAAGTAFDAAVAALSGAPKSETKNFGPFALLQPPEGLPDAVTSALARLAPGAVSDLLLEAKKGYLVQVAERKLPTVDPASPDYAMHRTGIATNSANATHALVLAELVEAEQQRNLPPRNQ